MEGKELLELKIGDDVTINWTTVIDEELSVHCKKNSEVYRFLYGKIIDILTENNITKYKIEYIDNISRWESGLKIELWDEKHITKRKNCVKKIHYYKTEPDFETIQKIVGGYFTIIVLENNKTMYVNEEGELNKLKINKEASQIVGYNIYGNVLIVG